MRLSSIPSYSPIALLRSKTHFMGGRGRLLAPLSALAPFHQPSPQVFTKQAFWRSLDSNQFPPTPASLVPRLSGFLNHLFLPGPIRSWLTFYLCGCWFLVSCASSIFLTPKHTEEAKSARSSAPLLHLSKGHTEAGSHRFQVMLQPDPGLPLPLPAGS